MANIGGPAVLPVILALVMFTAGSYLGLRIATLAVPRSWGVAAEGIGLIGSRGHRRGRLPSRVVGNGRLSVDCNDLRSHRPVFGGDGNPDRGGPIAQRAGRVHDSRDVHACRTRGYIRGVPVEERNVASGLRSRRFGRRRHRGRSAFLHARSYAPVLPVVITLVVLMIGRTMHRPQRRSELITAAYRLVDNRSWTRRHPATNVESEGGQPHPQAKEHES